MKKSIFKKIGGLFLGLAMGLGVAVGVTAGNKAGEVKASADLTINFSDFGFSGSNSEKTESKSGFKFKVSSGNSSNGLAKSATLSNQTALAKSISNVSIVGAKFSSETKGLATVYIGASAGAQTTSIGSFSTSGDYSYDVSSTITGKYLTIALNKERTLKFTSINITYVNDNVDTYTISFAAGTGGSGSKENVKWDRTKEYTIPNADGFSATGKVFDYWSGSDGVTYAVGSTIAANHFAKDYSLTLTAVWKDIPGEPTDYTKITNFQNASEKMTTANFKFSGDSSTDGIPGYKGGTSSVTNNSIDVTVPAGANELVIYCAGWKDKTVYLNIDSNYTDDGQKTLQNDNGMTSNTPFTLSESTLYADKYKVHFDLKNITSQTTLTLSFSGERVGLWYVGYKLGNVKTLKSIAVEKNPDKTSYNAGESFQTKGMVVKATYGNSQGSDTTETITGYTCNPSTSTALTSSNDKVTISYTEGGVTRTTEVAIDVAYFDGIKITTAASKLHIMTVKNLMFQV